MNSYDTQTKYVYTAHFTCGFDSDYKHTNILLTRQAINGITNKPISQKVEAIRASWQYLNCSDKMEYGYLSFSSKTLEDLKVEMQPTPCTEICRGAKKITRCNSNYSQPIAEKTATQAEFDLLSTIGKLLQFEQHYFGIKTTMTFFENKIGYNETRGCYETNILKFNSRQLKTLSEIFNNPAALQNLRNLATDSKKSESSLKSSNPSQRRRAAQFPPNEFSSSQSTQLVC